MFEIRPTARRRALPFAVLLTALVGVGPAFGQGADQAAATADNAAATPDKAAAPEKKGDSKPKVSTAKPPSPNAMVNLLNLMVKEGLLKQEAADRLIKQAEDEAYVARLTAKDATAKADEASKAASAAASAANPPGTRHVSYVPEVVKRQLREDIKREVMAKAEKENWASPGLYPEWAQRIHFYGDFRARYQGSFFPKGNDQADATNFNAINTGAPYNVLIGNPFNFPTVNATQNRNQERIRARLGMEADLTNGLLAGFRIATGQDSQPVSTNQSLGANGGDFSKYQLWLDRAYVTYQGWNHDFTASVGRFDNPFWSPTDLAWYRDLAFDGIAVQAKHEVAQGITPFVVAGAFPIFNTDFNFGTNALLGSKFASQDKYLFGGQVGVGYRFAPVSEFRAAVAFYDFENVQGQVSSPCNVNADFCDTDGLRPSFAQRGNTYMQLRNNFDPTGAVLATDPQFFGLLFKYRPVVGSMRLDLGEFDPYHIVIDGEAIWNTAFNRALGIPGTGSFNGFLPGQAVNNRAGTGVVGLQGPFNGGNYGWLARVTVGQTEIRQFGDWNVHAGYKYLQSDATIDAFVDSDFGNGGTNLKGYFLGGSFGLSNNVWTSWRWMSATNISGVPYAVDLLFVDLNARF